MVRPRSERAHLQVLDAAASLFAERGMEATSMDAIAAASGVSKATIYKHWPDKDTLALEVLIHVHGLDVAQPVFQSDDVRSDILALLRYRPSGEHAALRERLMPHLIAYSARNQEFGRAWRERVMGRQREALRKILARGVQNRQLARDLDPEFGVALLIGPTLYCRIFEAQNKAAPISAHFIEKVVDAFWRSFAAQPVSRQAKPKPGA